MIFFYFTEIALFIKEQNIMISFDKFLQQDKIYKLHRDLTNTYTYNIHCYVLI